MRDIDTGLPAARAVAAPRVAWWRIALPALAAMGAMLSSGNAHAQGATASSPPELARIASQLKPGEWVWAPSIAPTGPLLIYVDLSRQIATVYRNGVRIAVSTISSGKEGHETPTGVFTILQKDIDHHSSLYNDATMPFQQRLTWDGVALHAGGLPGYPESHGCVHLPYSFAQALFGVTSLGATVIVDGNAVSHIRTADDSLLVPLDRAGHAVTPVQLDQNGYSWTPERAPQGPMTIIISRSDQRIVVLRNGIEIGRSVADLEGTDTQSHVVSLAIGPDKKPHWVYVGLPGHDVKDDEGTDEAELHRVAMPRAFYDDVKAALQPGTTILLTQSSVGTDGLGQHITILDAARPAY